MLNIVRVWILIAAILPTYSLSTEPNPISLNIGRLEQISLAIKDIATSERFYEDVFGIRWDGIR